jgi:hypothetical protein
MMMVGLWMENVERLDYGCDFLASMICTTNEIAFSSAS